VVTQRQESDIPEILSGVFEGVTTGTSLAILVRNEDQKSRDYSDIKDKFRPGHADYTFLEKYGVRDYRGGGRSSARETVGRVAAGVIAKKVLKHFYDAEVLCYVKQIGSIVADVDPASVTMNAIETLASGQPNIVRCPDEHAAEKMVDLIVQMRKEQDSIGGVAEIVARGIPAGLGEPVFDKLKADLGKALFSLPAVLGVEYGIGFGCATLRGSENNDIFVAEQSGSGVRVTTATNRHGGMLGGISSGLPIVLRAAIKPTSSLSKEQATVTSDGRATTIVTKGRHDPCLLPRFAPMGEAMVAIVLADHCLRHKAQRLD
jgi:chorismate synthase